LINSSLLIFAVIQDDISFMQSVIPGLTKPAPYLIRGNPGLTTFGGAKGEQGFFWMPAFAGITKSALINVAMYKMLCFLSSSYSARFDHIKKLWAIPR